jgi:hypothetical protein
MASIEKERLEKILDIVLNHFLAATDAQYVHHVLEDRIGLSPEEMGELGFEVPQAIFNGFTQP